MSRLNVAMAYKTGNRDSHIKINLLLPLYLVMFYTVSRQYTFGII